MALNAQVATPRASLTITGAQRVGTGARIPAAIQGHTRRAFGSVARTRTLVVVARATIVAAACLGATRGVHARTVAGNPWMHSHVCGQYGGAQQRNADDLMGSMCGIRPNLARHGISLGLTESSEILGNTSGGTRRGFVYDGVTTATLQLDTQQAFGWSGGTFEISALQIHGNNLSARDLQSLQTASGIESDRGTRLWELWYDQRLSSGGMLDLRVGQQSLDQEWMVSQNALDFVNTMFGWAMLPSADLPAGGPAYPLSAIGARVRVHPHGPWTVLAGIYNGSPTNNAPGDPQRNDRHGTSFPLKGGVLAMLEAQYAVPASVAQSPASVYRIGAWYDSEHFADQEFDNTGQSLANPASDGIAREHRGDWSVYGVVDQRIWTSSATPCRTLNYFLRPMWTPLAGRNPIDFSLNAGLTVTAPLPNRSNDTFGAAIAYAHVGSRLEALDRQQGYPVHAGETVVEWTYIDQVTPWFQLQPDVQYVFDPGAGVTTTQRLDNETVLGFRANISF